MKKSYKRILQATLLILFIIAGWTMYRAYAYYAQYSSGQDKINYTILVETTFGVLTAIGDEETQSAKLMASSKDREESGKKLQSSRTYTDRLLTKIDKLISDNEMLKPYMKHYSLLHDTLRYARSKVDALSEDIGEVFVDLYFKNTRDSAVQLLSELKNNFDSEETKSALEAYIDISKMYAVRAGERSLLVYFLGKEKPVSDSHLVLWEALLSQNVYLDISKLFRNKSYSQIEILLNDTNTINMLDSDRISFAKSIRDGKYDISQQKINEDFSKRLGEIGKINEIIFSEISNRFLSQKTGLMANAKQYAMVALALLALIAILIFTYMNMGKDDILLEEALRKIAKVLNEDERAKLKEIVDDKDTAEIYNFLADTITESNKTKDLFLANMSHEIRTPLNGVLGFTQILKTTSLDKDQQEYIHIIEESSENLITIVNDILDLSKIKAEKIELEEIAFDPIDKFESAVEVYGAKALQKDIDFGVYIDPALPAQILGDPTRISQVLVNLISNAIKFTGSYGEVSMFCEKVDQESDEVFIKFSITDSGIGMTPEQQKHIFEEFTQADSSTTRKFGGTGLGLSISSRFVSLMGGKLELTSALGEGTTFYFTLPFKIEKESEEHNRSRFTDVSAGLLLPKLNIDRHVDKNLEAYARYLGVDFNRYSEEDIYSLDRNSLPDIIFVDQRYARRENEISRILGLETKIVFIVDGSRKKNLKILEGKAAYMINKPLNYTKVVRAIESCSNMNVDLQVDQNSNKQEVVFGDLNILVAEDNPINQKLIRTTLENYGANITIAANGEEALMLRKENEYDLIFMDVQMPVMNGTEATREILDFERSAKVPHIPIIALTANALKGDREKYISAGMDDYTPKPINIEKIGEIIERYCPNKRVIENETKKSKPLSTAVKKAKSNPKKTKKIDQKEKTVSKSNKNVLVYMGYELSNNIHAEALKNASYNCDLADSETDFLEKIDSGDHSFIFMSSRLLPENDCLVTDFITSKGAILYIYGNDVISTCENIKPYTSIADVLMRMKG